MLLSLFSNMKWFFKAINPSEEFPDFTRTVHKVFVEFENLDVSTYITNVDDEYIYLSEFEPKFLNYEKGLFEKLTIDIVWTSQLKIFKCKCHVSFRDATKINGTSTYRYTINKIVSRTEELFDIYPVKTDTFELHFRTGIKNYFIHTTCINQDRIVFESNPKLLEEYVESEIYNIYLTLPFSKHRISGILKQIKGEKFCFEQYLLDEELFAELVKYSEECFIYDFNVKAPVMEASSASKKKLLKQSVIIADDKEINIDVITKIVSSNYNFDIITCLDSSDILREINNSNPALLILDFSMPGLSGTELYEKIANNSDNCEIPLIFTIANQKQRDIILNEISEQSLIIKKPVNKKDLIQLIDSALKRKKLYSRIMSNPVAICSNDSYFCSEAENAAQELDKDVMIFDSAQNLLLDSSRQIFSLIILKNVTGNSLSELNILTSGSKLARRAKIIVLAIDDKEVKLLNALNSESVKILDASVSIRELLTNTGRLLEIL